MQGIANGIPISRKSFLLNAKLSTSRHSGFTDMNEHFKCPVCRSCYFGSLWEDGKLVGRYCKGWPSSHDRSYIPCRGNHVEHFNSASLEQCGTEEDRELLQWAAKAVNNGAWHPLTHDTPTGAWNPLANDDDAFRLANKLWLEVRHVHGQAHAGIQGRFWCTESWFPDGNQDAATRRAIVRAAATVGKQMEKT